MNMAPILTDVFQPAETPERQEMGTDALRHYISAGSLKTAAATLDA